MLNELNSAIMAQNFALGDLAPALLLPAAALGYALYFALASRTSGQQTIAIVDYGEQTKRAYSLVGDRADAIKPPVQGTPVQILRTTRQIDDLVVDGDCCFKEPIKVEGDLIINGRAVFEQTVTVNGHVHVKNHAGFRGGMICKGDVIVEGLVLLGTQSKPGWWIARNTRCQMVNYQTQQPQTQSPAQKLRLAS